MPRSDKSGKKKPSVTAGMKKRRVAMFTPESMKGAVRKIFNRVSKEHGPNDDGKSFSKKAAYVSMLATLMSTLGNDIAKVACSETSLAGALTVSNRAIVLGSKVVMPPDIAKHALAFSWSDKSAH